MTEFRIEIPAKITVKGEHVYKSNEPSHMYLYVEAETPEAALNKVATKLAKLLTEE